MRNAHLMLGAVLAFGGACGPLENDSESVLMDESSGERGNEPSLVAGQSGLGKRPLDFPELICRDAEGTGANLYLFRNAATYSQIILFERGIEVKSQFQEQMVYASTVHFFPTSSVLRYGQKPYLFEHKGTTYSCIEGEPFPDCDRDCDRPPVSPRDGGAAPRDAGTVAADAGVIRVDAGSLTDAGSGPTDGGIVANDAGNGPTDAGSASAGATFESMRNAIEGERPAATLCAPHYRGTIQVSAAFDAKGTATEVSVIRLSGYISNLQLRCMGRALSDAVGAHGAGTIDYPMSF